MTLSDTTIQGDVVVPDGQTWLIGKGVRIAGNLRTVGGTIALRPGSTLAFLGADPEVYVGGGMTFAPEYARDIGLWIGRDGALDVQCTPKEAWNRTGVDPTWRPEDEYWIAPTEANDFRARRWTPSEPVPQVDPRLPAAEIVNVTRDCVIEGPGHIHIHSSRPQRIEFVQLRSMGVSNRAHQGAVLGRYALHLHMSGNGTRGTLIRGVAAVGSQGKVFVPHSSHGITMIDNVSVNSYGEGMWWDFAHETNQLLIDSMVVLGVQMPDAISGTQSNVAAYTLGAGTDMEIRNSVAAAVMGGQQATGFDWPEPTGVFLNVVDKLVWAFDAGNVAHNNRGPGVRFWTNLQDAHVVRDYVSYRNGGSGVENGAYFAATEYYDITSFEDGYIVGNDYSVAPTGFLQNSSNTVNTKGRIGQLTNCWISSKEGPALLVGHRQLPATHHFLVQDCTLIAAPGKPKVLVGRGPSGGEGNPWLARFVRSGVTPDDIVFETDPINEGSEVLIDHEDGRRWLVRFENGVKVVRER